MNSSTILLIEDSRFFGQMIRSRIEDELNLNVVWAASMQEGIAAMDETEEGFLLALMGLTLPDAPQGEMVEYVSSRGLPSIILTATVDEEVRDKLIALGAADYILKEHPRALDAVLESIRRFKSNPATQVLVVDDSPTALASITKLLRRHRYDVLTATNGTEALEVMSCTPGIKLVLTDYNMPDIDGFALTQKLRANHPKDRLGIIGLSAKGNNVLAAKFLKQGANDFLSKPVLPEEFYSRVEDVLDMLHHIETIRDLSYRDPLTHLPNRRWFFEMAPAYMQQAVEHGQQLSLAMIDIDHFKKVNDVHGHDAGDIVIQQVARLIHGAFPETCTLPARFGGEEFAVLMSHAPDERIETAFEGLRRSLADMSIDIGGKHISVTISIGLCTGETESLHEALKSADQHLYTAKNHGRNRIQSGTCRLSDQPK